MPLEKFSHSDEIIEGGMKSIKFKDLGELRGKPFPIRQTDCTDFFSVSFDFKGPFPSVPLLLWIPSVSLVWGRITGVDH